MKKINKYILTAVLLLGCSCVYAQEAAFNNKELADLIAENLSTVNTTHEAWAERNPFDTSAIGVDVAGPGMSSNVLLQGIFLGGDKPSAIIDGTIVGLKDNFNGVTVKEIKQNAVVLEDSKGNQTVLSLKK